VLKCVFVTCMCGHMRRCADPDWPTTPTFQRQQSDSANEIAVLEDDSTWADALLQRMTKISTRGP
jgi:hypothetical protein